MGVAEDDRAGGLVTGVVGDGEPQPAAGRPSADPLDLLGPRGERLGSPLPGLPARDEPRDRIVEQRQQRRRVAGAAGADLQPAQLAGTAASCSCSVNACDVMTSENIG
jgi:hypothetical protein